MTTASKRFFNKKKNTRVFISITMSWRNFKLTTRTSSKKVAGLVFTVGGLASGAKGLMDVVKGATPGQVFGSPF